MSGLGDVTNGDRRTQLEQRAEAVRSRLEERLEALDERRDRMVHIAKKVSRLSASCCWAWPALQGLRSSCAASALAVRASRSNGERRWLTALRAGTGFFPRPSSEPRSPSWPRRSNASARAVWISSSPSLPRGRLQLPSRVRARVDSMGKQ